MSDPPEPADLDDQATATHSAAAVEPHRRILALDVGDRRIGLAISDLLGYTAQPLFTLHRTQLRTDLKSLARVFRKHEITDVVIGLPLHASGDMSSQAVKTQTFADALREQHPTIRFHLLDERLTTADAHALLNQSQHRSRGRGDREQRSRIIDQVAAVLLLETFLSTSSPRLLPPPPDF